MDNKQATQAELGWLAGIIDGEGYLTLAMRKQRQRPNYIACLEIANTEANIILKAKEIAKKLDVNLHVKHHEPPKTGNRKYYKLDCHRFKGVKILLTALLPYLVGKAKRAKLILDFIESRFDGKDEAQPLHNRNHPYNELELNLVYTVQDLVRSGESSEAIRETLRQKPQR
jgi:hypothetical protein